MTRAEKEERRAQVREDYINGAPVKEIAERYAITKGYVSNVCGDLPNRSRPGILSKRKDEVIGMRLNGAELKEIAEAYDVSVETLKSFLYTNGVKIRKPNDNEEVSKKISEKTNGLVEYVSGYTKKENPVVVRCTVCGEEFVRTFHSITCNPYKGCPACKQRYYDSIKAEREKQKQDRMEERKRDRMEERKRKAEANKAEAQAKHEAWINRPYHECTVCGTLTQNPKYCCEECRKKARNKTRDYRRRTKIRQQMVDADITIEGLFKRDNGVCKLCGRRCNWDDYTVIQGNKIAGDWYPSIDHIIPLSKNGLHSWDNVQLAHRRCNYLKNDKIIE